MLTTTLSKFKKDANVISTMFTSSEIVLIDGQRGLSMIAMPKSVFDKKCLASTVKSVEIKNRISLSIFRKEAIHSHKAVHQPLCVYCKKGEFVLCSSEYWKALKATATAAAAVSSVSLDIQTQKQQQNQTDSLSDDIDGEDDEWQPSEKENRKKKRVKVVASLSTRIRRAIAWDAYAFMEPDGMWTDIREEVAKLENQINELKIKAGVPISSSQALTPNSK